MTRLKTNEESLSFHVFIPLGRLMNRLLPLALVSCLALSAALALVACGSASKRLDIPSVALSDVDGDGVSNDRDNCYGKIDVDGIPDIVNPGQEDSDQDGVGDLCDNCPDDPNHDQADDDLSTPEGDACSDLDGDGILANGDGDDSIFTSCLSLDDFPACFPDCPCDDNCPDEAHDNPLQEDADGDGTGDACDACPNDSTLTDSPNSDDDDFHDCVDNCPSSTNAGQEDGDEDGVGDACDNCPDDPNTDQADDDLSTPEGDACADLDGDGILTNGDGNDSIFTSCLSLDDFPACFPDCPCDDNCPDEAHDNPLQEDADGDGTGDACDNCPNDSTLTESANSDQDDFHDCNDNCPGTTNPGQEDGDEDGVGDVCDNCPELPNEDQADDGEIAASGSPTQADGVGDACDNCPEYYNPLQADSGGDDRGDACDSCEDCGEPYQECVFGDCISHCDPEWYDSSCCFPTPTGWFDDCE